MLDWTNILSEVSKLFQEKKCLLSEISTMIAELKDKLVKMKCRRGKNLRRFDAEKETGMFKGIEITNRVDRRHDDNIEAINVGINDLLTSAEFFLQESMKRQDCLMMCCHSYIMYFHYYVL